MGKRKSRKPTPRPSSMKHQSHLLDIFDCPFCNDHRTVKCSIKGESGTAKCTSCNEYFQAKLTPLDEPVDVYHKWIDDLEDKANAAAAELTATAARYARSPPVAVVPHLTPASLVLSPMSPHHRPGGSEAPRSASGAAYGQFKEGVDQLLPLPPEHRHSSSPDATAAPKGLSLKASHAGGHDDKPPGDNAESDRDMLVKKSMKFRIKLP